MMTINTKMTEPSFQSVPVTCYGSHGILNAFTASEFFLALVKKK